MNLNINPDKVQLNEILDHRLQQEDIRRILDTLSRADRDIFLDKLSDMLGRLNALLEVSSQTADSLSLDLLFRRLMEVTLTALHADRGTIFLNDKESGELFSRVAMGGLTQEIRFPNHMGIAGAVFMSGEPILIEDAYADLRFNPEVDRKTGYRTRNILTAPIRNRQKDIIGVVQVLNKKFGNFTENDLSLAQSIAYQAASALLNAQLYEQVERARQEQVQLFEVTQAISSELHLATLLRKIMDTTTTILQADRSTLFLHDEKTNELWSVVAQGVMNVEIRFPSHLGIAGTVFTTGQTINIPSAYEDSRFNPEVDKKTGYVTHSILCAPVINKEGKILGVTQVLNRRGGPFNRMDEKRLKAFSAQASIAIENARLFEDVLNMKNYNESILESLSNGVITLGANRTVEKYNSASIHILGLDEEKLSGRNIEEVFPENNLWVARAVEKVMETGEQDISMDAELSVPGGRIISVNVAAVPLLDIKNDFIGSMLVIEDISAEKRLKGTLARYMTKEVADQLLTEAEEVLGGQIKEASILFSDIRSFTTISEQEGPQETVSMLNEYFTLMVDILFDHNGILDKYIGDAILAVFGTPFTSGKHADDAVRAAVAMMFTLDDFNRHRREKGKPPIKIGIGINTDEVLVGNIGSLRRMDFTVIGDGVNLASRLESATKYYGTGILISEFTMGRLTERHLTREIDRIKVKGKTRPVSIHEVLDFYNPAVCPDMEYVMGSFQEGTHLYRRGSWSEAIACFQRALRLCPGDTVSRLYIDRCTHLMEKPPEDVWDGVWVMTEK